MRGRESWRQVDSDLLGHFIDVVSVIAKSEWVRSKLSSGISNPGDAVLPSHQNLVFVAVYFRQLFCEDLLLCHATNTYKRFCDSDSRREAAEGAYKAAVQAWNDVPIVVSMYRHVNADAADVGSRPTVAQLFNAFMYGAHIFQSRGKVKAANVQLLMSLLRTYPQNILLSAIHSGLMEAHNRLQDLARIIYPDFRLWFNVESLPKPDVYWQNQLLNACADSEPLLSPTRAPPRPCG
jgi:hypothetical protein